MCVHCTCAHLQILKIQQLAPRGRDGSTVVGIAQNPAYKEESKERHIGREKEDGVGGGGEARDRERGGERGGGIGE